MTHEHLSADLCSLLDPVHHTGRNSINHTVKCGKSFGSELASPQGGGRRSRNAHVFALDPAEQEQKEDGKSLNCQQMIGMLWKILHLSCVKPWSSDITDQESGTWWWDYRGSKLRESFWAAQAQVDTVNAWKMQKNISGEKGQRCELSLSSLPWLLVPLRKQSAKASSRTTPGRPTFDSQETFLPVS